MQNIPIVIIEDEPEIRKFLNAILTANNFKPSFAENATDGIKLVTNHPPELIILDLGLPDIDGLELIKNIRNWSNIPILVLSARGKEEDKVNALELGADDYLTKPFGAAELLARLKVILRRNAKIVSEPIFKSHELEVNLQLRKVLLKGEEVHLTPTEYKLLTILIKNVGKVVTHLQLLKEVWGKNSSENSHYLRIYTKNLRNKLNDNPMNPKYIVTEAGIGYRFKS